MKTKDSLSIANPYTKKELLVERDLEELLNQFQTMLVYTGNVQKVSCASYSYGDRGDRDWEAEYKTYAFNDEKCYLRDLFRKLLDIRIRAAHAADINKGDIAANLIELGKAYKARFMEALEDLRAKYKVAKEELAKANEDKLFEKANEEIIRLREEYAKDVAEKEAAWEAKHEKEERIGNIKFVLFLTACGLVVLVPNLLHCFGVI